MTIKYNNLNLLIMMSKQQNLLRKNIRDYIKQDKQKYALVNIKAKPSSIILYKPGHRS